MFLLVPAYPGCPGSKAVKRSLLLLLLLLWLVIMLQKWEKISPFVGPHFVGAPVRPNMPKSASVDYKEAVRKWKERSEWER